MRIVAEAHSICGVCEACGDRIEFTLFDENDLAFYDATEIVNIWMDHQLNDCKPPVIDNPGGIGYSDFVTTHPLEGKVGLLSEQWPAKDDPEDDDEEGYEWDEEEDEDDDEDDDDLK